MGRAANMGGGVLLALIAAPAPAGTLHQPPVAVGGVLTVDGDAHQGAPPDTCPGDGSDASPFRSLSCAFQSGALRAETTLQVRDAADPYEGASTAGLMLPPDVTVEPAPGHAPILVGPLELSGVSGWTVRGLTLDGSGGTSPSEALAVSGGTGVRIEGVTVRAWPGRGIVLRGVGSSEIIGNRIEGARDVGIWVQDSPAALLRDNEVSDLGCTSRTFTLCDDCGIDQCAPCGDCLGVDPAQCTATSEYTYGGQSGIRVLGASSGVEIRGNSIHDFHDDACGTDGTRTAAVFITGAGASDGTIGHTLIERIAPGNPDNGFGILMFQSASGWRVEHNVLASIGRCGLCEGDPLFYGSRQTRWLRNTVIDVEGAGIEIRRADEVELIANLVAETRGDPVRVWAEGVEAAPAFDHNVYWSGADDDVVGSYGDEAPLSIADWQATCGCDAASAVGDPDLLPPPLDPTPGPDSAAIDRAPPLEGSPSYGAAPDAGAVEVPRVFSAEIQSPERSLIRVGLGGGPVSGVPGCVGFSVQSQGEIWPLAECSSDDDGLILELVDPAPYRVPVTLSYEGRHVSIDQGIGGSLGASLRAFSVTVSNGDGPPDPGDDTGSDTTFGGSGFDGSFDGGIGDDEVLEPGCGCREGAPGPAGVLGWAWVLLGLRRRVRDRSG